MRNCAKSSEDARTSPLCLRGQRRGCAQCPAPPRRPASPTPRRPASATMSGRSSLAGAPLGRPHRRRRVPDRGQRCGGGGAASASASGARAGLGRRCRWARPGRRPRGSPGGSGPPTAARRARGSRAAAPASAAGAAAHAAAACAARSAPRDHPLRGSARLPRSAALLEAKAGSGRRFARTDDSVRSGSLYHRRHLDLSLQRRVPPRQPPAVHRARAGVARDRRRQGLLLCRDGAAEPRRGLAPRFGPSQRRLDLLRRRRLPARRVAEPPRAEARRRPLRPILPPRRPRRARGARPLPRAARTVR